MKPIVISYIPALHQGYIKFFTEHPGPLFVLGPEFIKETPRMERDIRALEPIMVAEMVKSTRLMSDVQVLDDLKNLPDKASVIMPDEDVNRNFAKKHLAGRQVQFIPTFLRWDRQISTTEFEVPAGRTVSTDELDDELMAQAQVEADKSHDWWRQIGAIATKGGKPLISVHNQPLLAEDYTVNVFGDPRSNFDAGEHIELVKTIHAEARVIAEAARRGISLQGASMYVTTFPCPVCAKSIAAAGIKKVYYRDGYSLLDAEDILKAVGAEIILVK